MDFGRLCIIDEVEMKEIKKTFVSLREIVEHYA